TRRCETGAWSPPGGCRSPGRPRPPPASPGSDPATPAGYLRAGPPPSPDRPGTAPWGRPRGRPARRGEPRSFLRLELDLDLRLVLWQVAVLVTGDGHRRPLAVGDDDGERVLGGVADLVGVLARRLLGLGRGPRSDLEADGQRVGARLDRPLGDLDEV